VGHIMPGAGYLPCRRPPNPTPVGGILHCSYSVDGNPARATRLRRLDLESGREKFLRLHAHQVDCDKLYIICDARLGQVIFVVSYSPTSARSEHFRHPSCFDKRSWMKSSVRSMHLPEGRIMKVRSQVECIPVSGSPCSRHRRSIGRAFGSFHSEFAVPLTRLDICVAIHTQSRFKSAAISPAALYPVACLDDDLVSSVKWSTTIVPALSIPSLKSIGLLLTRATGCFPGALPARAGQDFDIAAAVQPQVMVLLHWTNAVRDMLSRRK